MAWAGGLLALLAGLLLLVACTVDTPPTSEGDSPTATTTTGPPTTVPAYDPATATPSDGSPPTTPAATRASATTAQPVPSDKPASPTVGPTPSAPSPPTAAPRPPSQTATPAAMIGVPVPPRRDLYELARSLRHKSQEPIPYLRYQTPSDLQVGTVDTFKVLARVEPVEFHEISAKLEHVSDNAYWYVQEGIRFDTDDLEEAAADFEGRVLPGLLASFGPMWSPDDLPGQRLTILHAPSQGLAGYYSSADEYPVQVHENSNQRKMIYIDPGGSRIGNQIYLSTLSHELQHAINWNLSGGQATWLNEGLSQVAEHRLGWRPRSPNSYVHSAPTSLVYWPLSFLESSPYYGSSFLFSQFLKEQAGSPESLEPLLRIDYRGIPAVDAYLESLGKGESFESIFGRWTVAGYLSEEGEGGPYGYADRWPSVEATDVLSSDGSNEFRQPQFSARYLLLDLEAESAEVSFSADVSVGLLPEDPPTGGHCWWGNYGDAISTTLTREFDFSSLQQATLSFTAWYSIEEDWDYAYVQVSTDGGSTWDILRGSLASTDNPSLNAYGPGYTGESGSWVSDSVDLTAYAGGPLLVRFHYVTDDGITGPGICLDSVAIPELGFYDDASDNQGWVSQGFYRTDNRMPQDFAVHLIEIRGDDATVTPVMLDENNRASLSVENLNDVDETVLVVGSLAESSRQPARYIVTVGGVN